MPWVLFAIVVVVACRLSYRAVQVVDLCAKYIIQGACWTIEREREHRYRTRIHYYYYEMDVTGCGWLLVNVQRVLVCHKLRINVDI